MGSLSMEELTTRIERSSEAGGLKLGFADVRDITRSRKPLDIFTRMQVRLVVGRTSSNVNRIRGGQCRRPHSAIPSYFFRNGALTAVDAACDSTSRSIAAACVGDGASVMDVGLLPPESLRTNTRRSNRTIRGGLR